MSAPAADPANPKPTIAGLVLRAGLFVLIGLMAMEIIPGLLASFAGYLIASALGTFTAAALANAITVRVYERGRLADLGLGWTPGSLGQFGRGLAAGGGAALAIVLVALLSRSARFERAPGATHPWASVAFLSIVLLFGAAGEELLFHGYAFQLLIRYLGAFATILPAAVLFGFAHLGNQNVTALGIFNTMLWGVLFGYAYVRTRALWMPIGLHYGWNIVLPLAGVNLSGFTMNVTGYELDWHASPLWSGGGYGPEGGVLTTVAVIVLLIVLSRLAPEQEEL